MQDFGRTSELAKLNQRLQQRQAAGLPQVTLEYSGRPDCQILKWNAQVDTSMMTLQMYNWRNRGPKLAGLHIVAGLLEYFPSKGNELDLVPYIALAVPAERKIYGIRAASAEQVNRIGAMATNLPGYSAFTNADLL